QQRSFSMAKNRIASPTSTTNGVEDAAPVADQSIVAVPAPPTPDAHFPPGDMTPPPVPTHRASAYAVAQAQLDSVADFMGLADDLRLFLRTPQRELIVHFPVQMDDGHMRMF